MEARAAIAPGGGGIAVVDYAHKPDALAHVLDEGTGALSAIDVSEALARVLSDADDGLDEGLLRMSGAATRWRPERPVQLSRA